MAKEILVYGILYMDADTLTDEEFIDKAEQQGLVWSLKGFEQAFNQSYISSDDMTIRII
jgi:hypothetical protein